MKNSNVKSDNLEDLKLPSPQTKFVSNQQIKQMINRLKYQIPQMEYIHKMSTEPSNQEAQLKIKDQDNNIIKYNQFDLGKLIHMKSFSLQRQDRYFNQKKDRYRCQSYSLPQELEPIEFQENKQDSIHQYTKKYKQKQKLSPNISNDQVKSNADQLDEQNNFEQSINLKLQQLQKNKYVVFKKKEQRKQQNIVSKTINDINVSAENLQISKPIYTKEQNESTQKKSNEFDYIINQENYLNQKIQKQALQKKAITNISSILANQFSSEDKINLIIHQQTNMLVQCNQNKDKLQTARKSKNSQILNSPLSSIKKEVSVYSDDISLPLLTPIQQLNNKSKLYTLNKRNTKKSQQRENSQSSNNNGSRLSQYSNSPDISFSSNSNHLRRLIDINQHQVHPEQIIPFIKENIYKEHLENADIGIEQTTGEKEPNPENIISPFDIQQKDQNKIQFEKQKFTMRLKSNTAQMDFSDSNSNTVRKQKGSYSQAKNYQEKEEQKNYQAISVQNNNQSKPIKIKNQQSHYLNTDFNIIQSSIENIRLNNFNRNNQFILPQLKLNSKNNSKVSNQSTVYTENINQQTYNQNQQYKEVSPFQLEETSADFFELQSYYQKKYNNYDKMPKNFNKNRKVFSVQSSLSKNQMNLKKANSNILDEDASNGSVNCLTTKRRSSSFFQSPLKQTKIKPILSNQNSFSINNQNQFITKKNKKSIVVNNDLQPWEDSQNLNETNFFQIIKERNAKLVKNKTKSSSKSQSKITDKIRGQSQEDKLKQIQ